MTIDDLRTIERLNVRAWPALETASIEGWLWRYSGGGSQRANSVSTIDFTGSDLAAAIEHVERRYHARNAPARFYTYDLTMPAELAETLRRRGYIPGESTITMRKPVDAGPASAEIEIADTPAADWFATYLGAITENRRKANAEILVHVPAPRAFFTCRRNGAVVSTGLGVVDGPLAVVECMATQAEARRQGGAASVLRGIETWAARQGAKTLALQVVAVNTAALLLYQRFGFTPLATNRYWIKE